MAFHLAPQRRRDWDAQDATFGSGAAKQMGSLGYRLHRIVTLGGVIRDVALTAAHVDERDVAEERLPLHPGRTFFGDNGSVDDERAERLRAKGVERVALRRKNQRTQVPKPLTRLMTRFRAIIETVNGQLTDQFGVAQHDAQSFSGLCARLSTK
jgi:hypothetical protein